MPTMSVRIDTRDYDDKSQRLSQAIPDIAREGLAITGTYVQTEMQKHAPTYRGTLRRSIKKRWIGSGMQMEIGSDLPYAKTTIEGAPPFIPPFDPIRKWSNFRDLPAMGVWLGIKQRGIASADESPYREDWREKGQERAEREIESQMTKKFRRWVGGL